MCCVWAMSRKELLHNFACLGRHEGVEIHDEKLEKDHAPRPTHRWFGGTPVPWVLLLHDMEEELYWDRLERKEPISPEVWTFLEDARLGRLTRTRSGWNGRGWLA